MSKKITNWPWSIDTYGSIITPEKKVLKLEGVALAHASPEVQANTKLVAAAPEIAHWANEVMQLLEKHGPGIVPHLMDTDDNAGQFLRDALKKGGWNE